MNNKNSNNGYVHDSSIRKAIKRDAKNRPKGGMIGSVLIIYAIVFVVTFALNSSVGVVADDQVILPVWANILESIVTIASSLILAFGVTWAALTVSRGNNFTLKDVFVKPFQKIGSIALCYLLMIGVVLLFAISMFIPFINIIMPFLLFAFMIYMYPALDVLMIMIMDDNMEKQPFNQLITSALELVKGRRVEYYGMTFSFFGWGILGIFTLGILYIWLIPYMRISIANMYRRWTNETDFTTSETGLSNGVVIGATIGGYFGCLFVFIISLVMFVSAGILTTVGLENLSNKIEKVEQNDYDGVDTSLTKNNREAKLKEDGVQITFEVPSGYTASEYNTNYVQYFDKKTNDKTETISYMLSYIYGDYYKTKIDAIKKVYSSDTYKVAENEFTVNVNNKSVKCYILEASTDYYKATTAYAFYPINDEYYALVSFNNVNITKDNISSYLNVK